MPRGKTEKGQRSEDGGRKTEDSGQRTEDRQGAEAPGAAPTANEGTEKAPEPLVGADAMMPKVPMPCIGCGCMAVEPDGPAVNGDRMWTCRECGKRFKAREPEE